MKIFNKSLKDTFRKMPSTILDTDEKYENLLNLYKELKKNDNNNNKKVSDLKVTITDNILEGLNWLTDSQDEALLKNLSEHNIQRSVQTFPNLDRNEKINVLVTGSLYLVGLTLKVLDFKID